MSLKNTQREAKIHLKKAISNKNWHKKKNHMSNSMMTWISRIKVSKLRRCSNCWRERNMTPRWRWNKINRNISKVCEMRNGSNRPLILHCLCLRSVREVYFKLYKITLLVLSRLFLLWHKNLRILLNSSNKLKELLLKVCFRLKWTSKDSHKADQDHRKDSDLSRYTSRGMQIHSPSQLKIAIPTNKSN